MTAPSLYLCCGQEIRQIKRGGDDPIEIKSQPLASVETEAARRLREGEGGQIISFNRHQRGGSTDRPVSQVVCRVTGWFSGNDRPFLGSNDEGRRSHVHMSATSGHPVLTLRCAATVTQKYIN